MIPPLKLTVIVKLEHSSAEGDSVTAMSTKEVLEWWGREAGQDSFGWCVGAHLAAALIKLGMPPKLRAEAADGFDDQMLDDK